MEMSESSNSVSKPNEQNVERRGYTFPYNMHVSSSIATSVLTSNIEYAELFALDGRRGEVRVGREERGERGERRGEERSENSMAQFRELCCSGRRRLRSSLLKTLWLA